MHNFFRHHNLRLKVHIVHVTNTSHLSIHAEKCHFRFQFFLLASIFQTALSFFYLHKFSKPRCFKQCKGMICDLLCISYDFQVNLNECKGQIS